MKISNIVEAEPTSKVKDLMGTLGSAFSNNANTMDQLRAAPAKNTPTDTIIQQHMNQVPSTTNFLTKEFFKTPQSKNKNPEQFYNQLDAFLGQQLKNIKPADVPTPISLDKQTVNNFINSYSKNYWDTIADQKLASKGLSRPAPTAQPAAQQPAPASTTKSVDWTKGTWRDPAKKLPPGIRQVPRGPSAAPATAPAAPAPATAPKPRMSVRAATGPAPTATPAAQPAATATPPKPQTSVKAATGPAAAPAQTPAQPAVTYTELQKSVDTLSKREKQKLLTQLLSQLGTSVK